MVDINTAVRFVDDWADKDPKTRDSSPGKVDGKQLRQIGVQKERRLLRRLFKSVKHVIFLAEGTHDIWYKNNYDYPAVVKMGFSLSRLTMHPNAVPMEFYYEVFMNPGKLLPVDLLRGQSIETLKGLQMRGYEWLELNDFKLTA